VCGTAASEEEAVSVATREKPDLMILDYHLRQGNGGAVMDRILRDGPMPHIFVSGGNMGAERPGAVLLSKPFMEHQLRAAVARAVGA
jgi:CheY-like chemotaxis protein